MTATVSARERQITRNHYLRLLPKEEGRLADRYRSLARMSLTKCPPCLLRRGVEMIELQIARLERLYKRSK